MKIAKNREMKNSRKDRKKNEKNKILEKKFH